MFKFMRSARAKQDSQFPDTAMAMASGSTLQANDIQRELILIAYRDTMRMHGVPAQWLDCKVTNIANGDGTERTQVQLIINKWSGHVLRYAMALERQLVMCLDRYEASVDHSEYEWVWKFSPECDCPFPDMPAPEEWAQKKVANDVRRTGPSVASPEPASAQYRPMPPTAASSSAPAAADTEFDLRDIFSDLKPEDMGKR